MNYLVFELQLMLLINAAYNAEAANPVFVTPPPGGGNGSIPENAAVGSSILALDAKDADGQALRFSIVSQNPATPAFTINSATDELVVPFGLDYETTTSFSFTFSVSDGSNTASTTYILTILDVDDTAPVFNPSSYAATITDSTPAGKTIVTVTATDVDSASFSYSIQGSQTTFAVDSAGHITVADQSALAGFIGSPVTIMVDANDGTNIGSAAITITNVATSPVFNVPPPDGGGTGSIAENLAIGSTVLAFDATDPNGEVPVFSIVSQNPATPAFTINGEDELVVPSGVDYETTTSFSFTFSVSDGTNTASTTYTLTITDVDDTAPVFSSSSYAKTITDSTSAGTTIVTVTATDVDSASFSYSIQGSQTTFAINSAGHITVADQSQLAVLIGPPVILLVEANDGINTRSAAITITVVVTPCSSSPCQNDATCTNTGTTTYTCTCLNGYVGINCESASPCNSSPCQNGGTCIDSTEGFTCDCLTGYIGQTCSDVPTHTTTTPTDSGITDKGLIAAISVSVCAAVVCVGALVIYCCIQRRKRNKKQKKDDHSTSAVRMEVIPDYGVIRDRMLDTKLGMKFTVNTGRVEFAGTDFVAWITRMYMTNNRDAERLACQMLTCKEILPVGSSCLDFRYDCSYTFPHEVATTTRTYDETRPYIQPKTDMYESLRSTGSDSFTTYTTPSGLGDSRPNVYETLKPPEQRQTKDYDRLNEIS